jgi:two-component system, chemotaxis family, protein-glutamate methylesterase/glutaminase
MATHDTASAVIVIGASTGGLAALRTIVAGLAPGLPAAVCVVQHIDGHVSHLPSLLAAAGSLPTAAANHEEPIKAGRIYVAPSDHHLIIGDGRLHLTRGPRENFVRPAVDPLFRSAAEMFGRSAIGVVLTGNLSDGAAGLYEIKRRGGLAVVQDPEEAEAPGMPQAAINYVAVDHCVPSALMPQLLNDLAARLADAGGRDRPTGETETVGSDFAYKRPLTLTCPECGGGMHQSELGTLLKFDCHIGHNVTAEAMAAGQFATMEKGFEVALRCMNERTELCRLMGEQARSAGRQAQAEAWQQAWDETRRRSIAVQELLIGEWMRPQG